MHIIRIRLALEALDESARSQMVENKADKKEIT
jgi:hypothetical protein